MHRYMVNFDAPALASIVVFATSAREAHNVAADEMRSRHNLAASVCLIGRITTMAKPVIGETLATV